ncbi:MAG: ABC transporter substrate-binding protein [Bacteroidia bacterium]
MLRLILSVLVLFSVFSCTPRRDLSQNSVIVHFLAEPAGLHPTNDHNAYTSNIFQCTQKRLVTLDLASGDFVPDALNSLPEILDDSMSYRCEIRSDLFWDNGDLLSLNDILFTFKTMICPCVNNPEGKSFLSNLEKIEIEDSTHFVIHLKERYFDNLLLLSEVIVLQENFHDAQHLLRETTFEALRNEEISEEYAARINSFCTAFNSAENGHVPSKMNGLGPYRVSDWQKGSYITLSRKEKINQPKAGNEKEKALPEKIIFRIIRDMEPVVLALKKQQIDFTSELSTVALDKLLRKDYFRENYKAEAINSFTFTYMGMNMRPEGTRTPVFTDVRVREAMSYLIPVEEIIHVIAKGQATQIGGFILPAQSDYDPSVKPAEFNIKKAVALLEDAGWKDTDGDNIRDKLINGKRIPLSFKLSYMISPVTKDMALMIRDEAIKAGVNAEPDPLDFSVFYQRAFAHDFDAMMGAWSKSSRPDDPRQLWHSESWSEHGANFTGFGSEYTDSLIGEINRELNPAKRKELMHQLQNEINRQHPYVYLFNATRKVALHKRFGDPSFSAERPHVVLPSLLLEPAFANATAN